MPRWRPPSRGQKTAFEKLMGERRQKAQQGLATGNRALSGHLNRDQAALEEVLGHSADWVARRLELAGGQGALLVYFDGLVDKADLARNVIRPLLDARLPLPAGQAGAATMLAEVLNVGEARLEQRLGELVANLLAGESVLLLDGSSQAVVISLFGWKQRALEESPSQPVLRGPREGFSETLAINVALVRRRLRDPQLVIESIRLGRRSRTPVAVTYLADVASPEVVAEVKRRLMTVDADATLESGQLEQLIEDNWLSPFPQIQNSERPDQVAAEILQGRVALITDGTPFVLLLPTTLDHFFKVPEDYYYRWVVGTLVRGIRFLATFIALLLPPLYIVFVSFHPGLLPTELALSIAASREAVPVPAPVEVIIMVVTMELLREAGIRLPAPLGPTIGIVGGLVIGQAAVAAGLISPVMVVVVAANAIATFAIPTFELGMSLRLLVFLILIMTSLFGLFGMAMAFMILLGHLSTLTSFGVPYMAPWGPFYPGALHDALVRLPWPALKRRPPYFHLQDQRRSRDRRPEELGGKNPGKR